jgi:hypothetical protein
MASPKGVAISSALAHFLMQWQDAKLVDRRLSKADGS